MNRFLVFFILFFGFISSLSSQSIYLGGAIGKVFKHRAGLPFEIPESSYCIDFSYLPYIQPNSKWYQYWHEPEFSLNTNFVHFGDNEVFGNAISLVPGILFPFFRNKKIQPGFYIGSGIALVSRQYNYENNNTNIAISTRWNNCTRFGFKVDWKMTEYLKLRSGVQITHFSNGRSSSPNSGINLLTGDIGVIKSWPQSKEYKQSAISENMGINQFEKFSLDLSLFRGFTSSGVPEGATYHVNGMNFTMGYHTGDFFRLLLGFERDFNEQMYHASRNNFFTREEANIVATRSSVFVGSELFMGPVSIRNQLGVYVTSSREFQDFPVHFQLMLQYYPFGYQRALSPLFGVVLKSHLGVSEFVGFKIGFLYRHPKKTAEIH
jgi:hypothetical protein